MNLVKRIMDQLSGEGIDQLSSLLGTDIETTHRAATAAVPTLLSALAGKAATNDGVNNLTDILSGLDSGALGNIAQMLGGNSGSLLSQGNSLIGSLFGDSMTAGIASAVSRFTGMNAGMVKTLLAYLAPLVLGKIAAQWKNQGGTAHALQSLFADQRDNIADAVPAGFSLADIPGLAGARPATFAANRRAEPAPVAASSPLGWLLPLAIALVGGFFLWQFLARHNERAALQQPAETAERVVAMKPVVPETNSLSLVDLAHARVGVADLFTSLNSAISDIRDPASAERARPALEQLDTKIDTVGRLLTQLSADSTRAIRPYLETQVHNTIDKANAALGASGISPTVRTLLQEIITKLTKWIATDNP